MLKSLSISRILCSALCFFTALASAEVPFGDQISNNIYNYHRHTPSLATSGKLATGGIEELKSLGFDVIIDLRTAAEGTETEAAAAKAAQLGYQNIPVGRSWPTATTMASFATAIDTNQQKSVLVHCASANRVGMMWSYYQISNGVPTELAINEGRAIGMKPSLEAALRQHTAAH